ncbi:hypothetical protein HGRIS_009883 [Hohenbuehelia grisea]|uniref:Coilin n=1 Tax=Hohenbuehelia grisea TaxID=104357 RepID=A0ABR3J2I3_9AGAR
MRLKLQTAPPLPAFKAWFSTDGLEPSPISIQDLKQHLHARVEKLRSNPVVATSGRNLILTLEDFELLDECSVTTLRDGDLICVGLLENPTVAEIHLGKRKRSSPLDKAQATLSTSHVASKPRVLTLSTSSASSSGELSTSEESSSDTSGSDSDSDSTSDSSDSSDSDSDSDSDLDSSSSGPIVLSTRALAKSIPNQGLKNFAGRLSNIPSKPSQHIAQPHVPPGHGLSRTRSRNKRKRLSRLHARLEDAGPPPPSGSSLSNTIPLGVKTSQQSLMDTPTKVAKVVIPQGSPQTTHEAHVLHTSSSQTSMVLGSELHNANGVINMVSLRNKNKKKGFKNSMSRPIPDKVVFMPDGSTPNVLDLPTASSSSSGERSEVTSSLLSEHQQFTETNSARQLGRLIPPSEKQEKGQLPSNMFVTSVDVEEDLWSTGAKSGMQRTKPSDTVVHTPDEPLILDYGAASLPPSRTGVTPDATQPNDDARNTLQSFDWNTAESRWAKSPAISAIDQLRAGMLVGWKALAINPKTCTPEFLLSVARIATTSPSITIKHLVRPGAADLSFYRDADMDGIDAVDDPSQTELGDEETVTWNDISANEWRTILD